MRKTLLFIALMLTGAVAYAAASPQQPDITLNTPEIKALERQMERRFTQTLRPHFDSGALGFGQGGLVVVRESSLLPLKTRSLVAQAVLDDNDDRRKVYREVAVANGHPEWEGQIREVFSKQWIASARTGWFYQDGGGAWKQK